MLTANEIRDAFTSFFESKGHHKVPSAPMVIKDDPTLMFTNAGMNQFKDIILGNRPAQWKRVTDSQKCLRVSGKHNDLEEVGHDTYHHTMFEMLGNWSFGDYFKKEAISWAWEFLVDVLKLNPEDLYATVFEGSPAEGLERDNEAASYWEQFLPKSHIINGNKHDNFWEMGDTGPCGPCSEIHLDSRSAAEKAAVPGYELVNKDHPQVIEIWNLVFMQYNRKADQSLEPLPAKVIDTGMGFERLVRSLQGKQSNYDTDIFQPIIQEIGRLSGLQYGKDEKVDVAMRVVADHLRTIAFSIADGQLPSNAKAGYVIRRILRRAIRYAYTFLGQKEAFIYKLLPVLIREMGTTYPELDAQRELIAKVMKEEEDSFLRTLDNGINLLSKAMDEVKAQGKTELDGVQAFTLFDTYGFPLDLTELICRENGLTVDEKQFGEEMEKQKARARNAAAVETGDWITLREGETEFVGYDYSEYECHILRYRKITQKKQTFYQIVLDYTPFYGEMGGQVGECGVICSEFETIDIVDAKHENGMTVHIANKQPEHPEANFMACVDLEKRAASAANHSATHLLDAALRQVLGTHVEQKGSFVGPDYFRFDFSHFSKMTDEELTATERLVNSLIRKNSPLQEKRDATMEEAMGMGAIALFGEKYGDRVRVVKFGDSVELCGGTHAASTGRIGFFKIVSESAIAAGVRRIEALTGEAAEDLLDTVSDTLKGIREMFNNVPDITAAVTKMIGENTDARKKLEEYAKEKAAAFAKRLSENSETVNGINIATFNRDVDPAMFREAAAILQKEVNNFALAAAYEHEGKPQLLLVYSADLVAAGRNAAADIKEAAKFIQGGGGGQPFLSTAGGRNVAGLQDALNKLVETATR